MLNGKFYTGLPPKMIDRRSGGGQNRLESHLFWPDDTKTETAAENRIKRRNSVQLAGAERPIYEKQNSVIDDVDTRKRFSKEFSQSSIKFYDNLNENNTPTKRSMMRNSAAHKKMDITEKPTNTKLELPDSVVNEAYTAAKKNQAYASKIEFYDYMNDGEQSHNRRNNLRKPKMDMNDKREMELNSKNSPKLQMKRDVRSLSEEKEQQIMNNREMRTMPNDINERRERILNNEDNYLRNRRSVEPRMNVSPKRSWDKPNNTRYSSEREIYREPETLYYERYRPIFDRNSEERFYRATNEDDRYSSADYENFENNSLQKPKRGFKNSTRYYSEEPNERNYTQASFVDEDITDRMSNISLKSKQPQQEYYSREQNYNDERYFDQNEQLKTPTNRGSSYSHCDFNEREYNEVDLPYKNNNPKRLKNNTMTVNKINNQFQRETPVVSPTSPSPSDAESSTSATKLQKHLRSSLCFNNGEIVGENDVTTPPTTSNNPTHKRNARSSATQRVSVGLPD